MTESSRSDPAHAHDGALEADRDAKIEQLLLIGLDHYFAAQYEQAINIWTRALFFDRSHARARAYIERARSALDVGTGPRVAAIEKQRARPDVDGLFVLRGEVVV